MHMRVFAVHLNGMQRQGGACVGSMWGASWIHGRLMPMWFTGHRACRELPQLCGFCAEHEPVQKHCRDCKRHCLWLSLSGSFQILLEKVQKDDTHDIPYPELAVFLLIQRMDHEGSTCRPKCWDVSDSSR